MESIYGLMWKNQKIGMEQQVKKLPRGVEVFIG